MVRLTLALYIIGALSCPGRTGAEESIILLDEDFSGLPPGMFSAGVVGAHAEYHYLPQTAPKGHWLVSCFTTRSGSQRAWRVIRTEDQSMMHQTFVNNSRHSHPMLASSVPGDEFWRDYTVSVRFAPESDRGQSGLAFRYRNDRCYYFFGVKGGRAVLKLVRHGTDFRKPYEKVLAEKEFTWTPGAFLTAMLTLRDDIIEAVLENEIVLAVRDSTFQQGKVALMADVPTRYSDIRVTAGSSEGSRVRGLVLEKRQEEAALQAAVPKMKLWKRMVIRDYGVGRNLRFGDLNSDGEIDVLFGQVLHHGPKDRNSELSCLTATTLDGTVLWQIGEPDPWKDHLTNDVAFQIHDLDGDDANEVIYCMNQEIVVADGATGLIKYKAPTPETPPGPHGPHNIFPRILGDCLYFCDLRGIGRDSDIIIKDRYRLLWALNDRLEVMWSGECNTGHYPFAYDVDNDGRDELSMGYTLFDDDGTRLWTLDDALQDHADGVAIVRYRPGESPRLMCAASDEGMFFADLEGNMLKHHYLGHVQNPAVANFRDDLPGLETVSINFWGNQGIIHYFDANGDLYYDFEPVGHGSMCLPVNWTGKTEEFFVLSPNVGEGGMYDGRGRRAVNFPADGHPELCNAVLDITGDCRDEVVVWDAHELWIYTQDDNPKKGVLYRPVRNPLYNSSNYQATVSLPARSE